MYTQRIILGGWLWAISGLLLAVGFVIHPPLTADGMLESIWIPDHIIILFSLFAIAFALNLIVFGQNDKLNPVGWMGYVSLSLGIFLFIGIVYFELFLIPILARDLPALFDAGLRIGPLKVILPVSAVLFILGHLFLGVSSLKMILPRISFIALILFSIPVAMKPVLPDLIANIGAIGYGIASIYFAWKLKTSLKIEV